MPVLFLGKMKKHILNFGFKIKLTQSSNLKLESPIG